MLQKIYIIQLVAMALILQSTCAMEQPFQAEPLKNQAALVVAQQAVDIYKQKGFDAFRIYLNPLPETLRFDVYSEIAGVLNEYDSIIECLYYLLLLENFDAIKVFWESLNGSTKIDFIMKVIEKNEAKYKALIMSLIGLLDLDQLANLKDQFDQWMKELCESKNTVSDEMREMMKFIYGKVVSDAISKFAEINKKQPCRDLSKLICNGIINKPIQVVGLICQAISSYGDEGDNELEANRQNIFLTVTDEVFSIVLQSPVVMSLSKPVNRILGVKFSNAVLSGNTSKEEFKKVLDTLMILYNKFKEAYPYTILTEISFLQELDNRTAIWYKLNNKLAYYLSLYRTKFKLDVTDVKYFSNVPKLFPSYFTNPYHDSEGRTISNYNLPFVIQELVKVRALENSENSANFILELYNSLHYTYAENTERVLTYIPQDDLQKILDIFISAVTEHFSQSTASQIIRTLSNYIIDQGILDDLNNEELADHADAQANDNVENQE